MVQECYKYVDAMTDLTIKLRLIDTLRTVTAGKVWNVFKNSSIWETKGKKVVYIYLNSCEILHATLRQIGKT